MFYPVFEDFLARLICRGFQISKKGDERDLIEIGAVRILALPKWWGLTKKLLFLPLEFVPSWLHSSTDIYFHNFTFVSVSWKIHIWKTQQRTLLICQAYFGKCQDLGSAFFSYPFLREYRHSIKFIKLHPGKKCLLVRSGSVPHGDVELGEEEESHC